MATETCRLPVVPSPPAPASAPVPVADDPQFATIRDLVAFIARGNNALDALHCAVFFNRTGGRGSVAITPALLHVIAAQGRGTRVAVAGGGSARSHTSDASDNDDASDGNDDDNDATAAPMVLLTQQTLFGMGGTFETLVAAALAAMAQPRAKMARCTRVSRKVHVPLGDAMVSAELLQHHRGSFHFLMCLLFEE